MNTDQIEKLVRGKTPLQVAELARVATDPILMVRDGLDFTNVAVQSVPGAVKFCVMRDSTAMTDPTQCAVGYVLYVNGKMSPLYELTESDISRLESKHHGSGDGLRNTRLICAQ